MILNQTPFGLTRDGTATLFTLTNARGLRAQITNYGGILTALHVPDRDGQTADVVLGYDTLDEYLSSASYFGALVGRYANRIKNGRFALDGRQIQLAINQNANHLHGGKRGFDKRLWNAKPVESADAIGVQLDLLSFDGEEGFPGDLQTRVTYWLTRNDELRLEYHATCDAPTILCLTNHSYFNLAGAGRGDILGHELTLDADSFTPVDEAKIPTGEVRAVGGTPFDFRDAQRIGAHIAQDQNDEQLRIGNGYDHNFVLRGTKGELKRVARVVAPDGARQMEVWTTEPGVQFYSGNALGNIAGKAGQSYGFRGGLCLETQHFPDSPNHPDFPSVVLRRGETYRQTTVYRFGN